MKRAYLLLLVVALLFCMAPATPTPAPPPTAVPPTAIPPTDEPTPSSAPTETPVPTGTPVPTDTPGVTPSATATATPGTERKPKPSPTWDCNREYNPEKCLAKTGLGDLPYHVRFALLAIAGIVLVFVILLARAGRRVER